MKKKQTITVKIDDIKTRDPNALPAKLRKGGTHELPKKKKTRNERRKQKQKIKKDIDPL